jgi:hypothetical protein
MSDQPSLFNTDENAPVPKEEEEGEVQVLTPTASNTTAATTIDNGQKKQADPIMFKTITAWQKYYDSMGEVRQQIIERLAKQQEFNVTLNPIYDEKGKLAAPDEQKTFRRRKISTRDFFETERMRGVLQNMTSKNPLEIRDVMIDLYKKMSRYYLEDSKTAEAMTEEEFWRVPWPVNKAILDACNLSSVLGQVPLDQQI